VTQYVFDSRKVSRYRFPTHTNDLIMDRRDAATSEAFFVILEPGEAPPLHVHPDAEQVFFVLRGTADMTVGLTDRRRSRSRPGTSSGRRPVSITRSAAPARRSSCTSASTASPADDRRLSRRGTATSARCAPSMAGTSTPSPSGQSKARITCTDPGTAAKGPSLVIRNIADIATEPQTYADYRPIFETKRLNVTHVRIWPGETVPAHTHLDEDQVYFVVSGEGFVELDSERTLVRAGSGVLIPMGTEHLITNTGAEPLDYVFFVVFVPEHA
jgi:mannose-6-phosphate isomerase-like protein (cupin superfamily)